MLQCSVELVEPEPTRVVKPRHRNCPPHLALGSAVEPLEELCLVTAFVPQPLSGHRWRDAPLPGPEATVRQIRWFADEAEVVPSDRRTARRRHAPWGKQ